MASDEPGPRSPVAGGETPLRFSALLAGPAVIPVLSIETADDAVPLARALIDGGLRVLEVTLRTDCAIEAAKRIIAEVPGALVGIGTVTRPEEFEEVMGAGARFAVSPGLTPALGDAALASGLPLVVPDYGGCAEVANPLFAETFRARDGAACAEAIERLLSRDQRVLRNAARVAAGKVFSDRDHAEALIARYQLLLDGQAGERVAA